VKLLHRFQSARFVLTAWYSFLLCLFFIILGWSVYFYLDHLLRQNLDDDLRAEADWIYQLIDVERNIARPRRKSLAVIGDIEDRITKHFRIDQKNYAVLITSHTGQELFELEHHDFEKLFVRPPQQGKVDLQTIHPEDSEPVRVATIDADGVFIYVAFPERNIQAVLEHVFFIFFVLGPVTLLIAIGGGWIISGAVLKPVRDLARQTKSITATNLTKRIPTRSVPDEFGLLIDSINDTLARLEKSFDEIKQFSMNVAHELKTPLTILRGEAELALTRALSRQEFEQLITTYLEETGRMAHIVDDMLTLAKGEAGQIPFQKNRVQVGLLLQEIYEDALTLASTKDISVHIEESREATVLGDESRLRQLLRILVTNAIQYTGRGGTVTLACRVREESVLVSVADNGIGIPSESLDKIFDRFYRVDNARSRVSGGSGLGLSLAHWIATSHAGTIDVQSEIGVGTKFTFSVPRVN